MVRGEGVAHARPRRVYLGVVVLSAIVDAVGSGAGRPAMARRAGTGSDWGQKAPPALRAV